MCKLLVSEQSQRKEGRIFFLFYPKCIQISSGAFKLWYANKTDRVVQEMKKYIYLKFFIWRSNKSHLEQKVYVD